MDELPANQGSPHSAEISRKSRRKKKNANNIEQSSTGMRDGNMTSVLLQQYGKQEASFVTPEQSNSSALPPSTISPLYSINYSDRQAPLKPNLTPRSTMYVSFM